MEAKDYIYAFGILITLVLGIWNLIQTHRATRKTSFIKTVSAQRVLWIAQMRQDVSKFVGLTHTWAASGLEGNPYEAEILKEIDCLRYIIRLRLTPNGVPDSKMAALVEKIPELTDALKRTELMTSL